MKPSRRLMDHEKKRLERLREIARYLDLDLRKVAEWKPGREGK